MTRAKKDLFDGMTDDQIVSKARALKEKYSKVPQRERPQEFYDFGNKAMEIERARRETRAQRRMSRETSFSTGLRTTWKVPVGEEQTRNRLAALIMQESGPRASATPEYTRLGERLVASVFKNYMDLHGMTAAELIEGKGRYGGPKYLPSIVDVQRKPEQKPYHWANNKFNPTVFVQDDTTFSHMTNAVRLASALVNGTLRPLTDATNFKHLPPSGEFSGMTKVNYDFGDVQVPTTRVLKLYVDPSEKPVAQDTKGGNARSDSRGDNTRPGSGAGKTQRGKFKGRDKYKDHKEALAAEAAAVDFVNEGIADTPYTEGDLADSRASAEWLKAHPRKGLLEEGTLPHTGRPRFTSLHGYKENDTLGFQGDRFSSTIPVDLDAYRKDPEAYAKSGRWAVIPTIYPDDDGVTRLHTGGDAEARFRKTNEHFGIFEGVENGELGAQWDHHTGNAEWAKGREIRQDALGGETPKWTWGTYRWNPEAKGGRLVDPKNIKGTGIAFDERDRAVLPDEKRGAFEAWMDELANPKGEWESDDGRKVRVSSRLVPKDWRTDKTYNRDYDYVRAFLLTEDNPELRNRLVGPLYHEEDGKYWLHMNDLGKLPTHATFSRGSYYARNPRYADLAGDWEGETYIPGKAERGVRQDALGGDAGSETVVSETPVSEAPQNPGGPRIVINPQVFKDKRDALCVAFNEAFRVVMEMNGFEPVSEPTEKQRKFFSDTAYAADELQLRRTILARIATLDTSVKDPTDEQLEETAEMLEMVTETGAPQNEWEQSAVQRLHDVVVQARESTRANGSNEAQPEPPEDEASTQADVGGGVTEDDDNDSKVLPEQPAAPQPEQPAAPQPEQPAAPQPEQPAAPQPEQRAAPQPDTRPAAPTQKPDQGRVHARWKLNSSFTDKDGRRMSNLHHFDRNGQGRVHAAWALNSSFTDKDGRRVSNLRHFDRDERGRVHAKWALDEQNA